MTMPDDRRFDPATDDDLLRDTDRVDSDRSTLDRTTMDGDMDRGAVGGIDADRNDLGAGTGDRTMDADVGLSSAGASRTAGAEDVTDTAATTGATGDTTPEPLVAPDAVVDFRARWDVIQQGFVDDPRNAVSEADHLVDDLLNRLSETFGSQRKDLEKQWSDGEPSTEDLRTALQRYRAFFQRLLTI